MSRRSGKSGFEAWVSAATLLPWWVNLVVAISTYILLHHLAQPAEIPKPTDIGGLGVYGGQQLRSGVAIYAQYLVPTIFFFGIVGSAFKAQRSRKRFEETVLRGNQAGLLEMSWQQFEQLVGEYFRRRGYEVVPGQAGPDGGVDLSLRNGAERFVVQCKQWRATRVGVEIVRQLYGVMAAGGASGAFVVSSGQFTPDAHAFSEGRNILLIDGAKLAREMQSLSGVAAPPQPQMATAQGMRCPTCGGSMTLRTARKGANAGNQFWGCMNYPQCRGTRVSTS